MDGFAWTCECTLQTPPTHEQSESGLTLYYDASKYIALAWLMDMDGRPVVAVQQYLRGELSYEHQLPAAVDALQMRLDYNLGQLTASVNLDGSWQVLAENIDVGFISDEGPGAGHFTGAFVGIFGVDQRNHAEQFTFKNFNLNPTDMIEGEKS